jgi:putative cell wall-binding protein
MPEPPRARALARGAVGAIVACLLGTSALVAAPTPARTQDAERPVVHRSTAPVADADLAGGATATLEVHGGPELVGLTWRAGGAAAFEVRGHSAEGWTDWVEVHGGAGDEPDAGTEGGAVRAAGPAYLGHDVERLQLRVVEGDPRGVVVHGIDSEPVPADAAVASAATAATSSASAAPTRAALAPASTVPSPPPMVTRAQWGADEGWRDDAGGECDGTPDYSDAFVMAAVHHTVSSNTYAAGDVPSILRGIYDFHVHQNGWCDIAYTFFVDRFGTIYEGRYGGVRRPVIGAHTSGFNTTAFGVAAIGDFRTAPVPPALYDGLVKILSFKMAFHGIDPKGSTDVTVGSNSSARWPAGTTVRLPNLEGHRDSNSTECPGDQLYGLLPKLRDDVAAEISAKGYRPGFTVPRTSGEDRYATAAAVARDTFASAPTAYLARGDAFPDALAASYAAGLADVPILLTTSTSVPAATTSALSALGVRTVHVLGGPTAVSPQVDASLQSQGYAVDRVGGDDRFATAAALARIGGPGPVGGGELGTTALLSSGRSFPDALAAGGMADALHLPQLLAEPDSVPASTASALQDLGIQRVLLVGGPLALSAAVEDQVRGLGIAVERIAGPTRWDTAVALADLAADRYGFPASHVDVTTGLNFPDALAAGPHAGRTRSLLLLTTTAQLPGVVTDLLHRRASTVGSGHVIGGRTALDPLVKLLVAEALRPNG